MMGGILYQLCPTSGQSLSSAPSHLFRSTLVLSLFAFAWWHSPEVDRAV